MPVLESLFNEVADLQDCWKTYLLHIDLKFYFSLSKTLKISPTFYILRYCVLLKNVKCKVMFTDAYLEPSLTCDGTLLLFWSFFFLQKCSLANVWLGSKYPTGSAQAPCKMVPLVLFCNSYVIFSSSFIFENKNITLKNIWLLSQDLHSIKNTTCTKPLFNIGLSKIKNN